MADSPPRLLLPVGRITGHRGVLGEVTVRVFDGDAAPWSEVSEVWIAAGSKSAAAEPRTVRSARAYRDRLVLALAGIEDASTAAALRGNVVSVAPSEAPRLPRGQYWRAALVGMEVLHPGGVVGRVVDILITAGPDLLVIRADASPSGSSHEILVPWVDEIVESVSETERRIVIRPPEGLLELDREAGREAGREDEA